MLRLPPPTLQVEFSRLLARARTDFLQDALARAVESVDIELIDRELAALAPRETLNALARHGLRGELLFAVPALLRANPRLVGYYRLVLGYSQKEFYNSKTGAAPFKSAEAHGRISGAAVEILDLFCRGLNAAADVLAQELGADRLSRELLDDLSLLTLGPQLRGGANVRKGDAAVAEVFEIVHGIVKRAVLVRTERRLEIRNAARRRVVVEFGDDPDIVIREEMSRGNYRNVVAIEIKGGRDFSNIHNRLGEAEKSHVKARRNGYDECWTVINVDLDDAKAKAASPTTSRFYRLAALHAGTSREFQDFRNRIRSLTAIRG